MGLEQPEYEWQYTSDAMNSSFFCYRSMIDETDEGISSLFIARMCLYAFDSLFKFFLLYLFCRVLIGMYRSLSHDVHSDYYEKNVNQDGIGNKMIKSGSIQHVSLQIRCDLVKKQMILLLFCASSTFIFYVISAVA